jgi:hypothetical protein
LPSELRAAVELAGGEAPRLAAALLALTDSDPEAAATGTLYDTTQTLYVAAASGYNLHNGIAQHALRLRPRAVLHKVEGTHFDFLTQISPGEVAQLANEFLLGATDLLG